MKGIFEISTKSSKLPKDFFDGITKQNLNLMIHELGHEEARRGSRTGVQGVKGGIRDTPGWTKENRVQRAIIPKELCDEIANFCIGNNKIIQKQIPCCFHGEQHHNMIN